ncbi:hypothetical protein Taro_052303 [Colocasia esculenta]|uniref:Glutamate receptor n=1 Tax=Colocasia esculenta TaxID=4460 RepID=A0A843XJ86_COLES|nr:hypothetical protein [Colocasia esculenta]
MPVVVALDLLKNVQVQAIIGPLTSSQAEFVLNLGSRSHVPIVSFSATSPSLSPAHSPYFVRAALNDSSQVTCIAALLDLFGWKQVVPIYEDTGYGTGIVPYLVDAFQEISTRIPYRSVIQSSASDDQIRAELYKLKTMSTRVFVVHMSSALGSRLFLHANEVGMMEEGYVWLITDGLTNLLDAMDPSVLESMQGVLGVRSYVPRSSRLSNFTAKWRAKFRQENPEAGAAEPSLFSLWAYDTIWALAMAAERVKNPGTNFQVIQGGNNSTELGSLGVSQTGPKLLRAIMDTRFRGLSGDFLLVDGQLQSSTFQIVNVNGKGGREVAFWTPANGISRKLVKDPRRNNTQRRPSPVDVGPIIWPGEARAVPKGWETPTGEKKLRVGVPVKDGFKEFVDVERDPITNQTSIGGYCIEVFDAVMNRLPYAVPYEYVPFPDETTGQSTGSYDELIRQVAEQKYDAVVGDTTILGYRSSEVDFTLPFTESGWSMVVRVKENRRKNAWIFVKPWTTGLWVVCFAFFLFTGFVVWMIEHRINPAFRGPPAQQFGTIFYFAFSTMVFSQKETIVSNFSRFVVIVWVFVVLILQSSFTASLASLLTVQQLEPSVTDIGQLLRNGDNVGYQEGSFIGRHLGSFGFDDKKIISYKTTDQYAEALSKGSSNGGVSAIFDEIPYIKVFLSQFCADYTMAGPTYKTDGFGFVFPRGSPLVPDISRGILNVTEGEEMTRMEKKWFQERASCPSQDNKLMSSTGLTLKSFEGLFFITGGVSVLALLLFLAIFFYENRHELETTTSEDSIWKRAAARLVAWGKHYDKKDLSSHTFRKDDERRSSSTVYPEVAGDASPARTSVPQSPVSTSVHSDRGNGSQPAGEDMFSRDMDGPQAQSDEP